MCWTIPTIYPLTPSGGLLIQKALNKPLWMDDVHRTWKFRTLKKRLTKHSLGGAACSQARDTDNNSPVNNELKVHSFKGSFYLHRSSIKKINQKKRKMRECARETGKYFMAVKEGENWMIPAELKTEAKTPLSWETGPKLKRLNHTIIHHLWWWQQRMKNTTYTIMSVVLHYSHLQPCLKGIWVGFIVIHWWEDSPWVTENKTGLKHCH